MGGTLAITPWVMDVPALLLLLLGELLAHSSLEYFDRCFLPGGGWLRPLSGRQLLDPRPPPHDEGGMASVMNIYPPAERMGIPPRYSLTGGEGETPAKARWPGQSSTTGGPHHRHG